ncbi:hypothetical protein TNCV_1822061 [Trichonephila clavipes]|nr:hypothetical protein TNCV_1822061 [Trichonephila clavipes]
MEPNTVSRREVKANCKYPHCAHGWSSQNPTALVERSQPLSWEVKKPTADIHTALTDGAHISQPLSSRGKSRLQISTLRSRVELTDPQPLSSRGKSRLQISTLRSRVELTDPNRSRREPTADIHTALTGGAHRSQPLSSRGERRLQISTLRSRVELTDNNHSRREVNADYRYPHCAHGWSSQIPTALVER